MTQPYSRHRLLQFNLVELPRDINGQLDGAEYAPFLGIRDIRTNWSLRTGPLGVWSGRQHSIASEEEKSIFASLEANPKVISIREQYPLISAAVVDSILAGETVHRNRVQTIDFVLTLPPANFGGPLRYHGLSSKSVNKMDSLSATRRENRERDRLAKIGWQWSYVAKPKPTEFENNKNLRRWAMAYPIDDGAKDARALAELLYKTTSNKPLTPLLAMLGKRLGIPEEDQYFVLAAAYYFGYIRVDHRYLLDEWRTLVMSPRSGTPW